MPYLPSMPTTTRWILPALATLVLGAAFPAQTDSGSRVLAAAELPGRASDLRDAGMPAADVAQALTVMRRHQVPAGDAAAVLKTVWDARREQRPGSGAEFVPRLEALLARNVPPALLADSVMPWSRRPIHRVSKDQ